MGLSHSKIKQLFGVKLPEVHPYNNPPANPGVWRGKKENKSGRFI